MDHVDDGREGKRNGNNSDWQFWQQHNQPIEIVNQKMYDEIANIRPFIGTRPKTTWRLNF